MHKNFLKHENPQFKSTVLTHHIKHLITRPLCSASTIKCQSETSKKHVTVFYHKEDKKHEMPKVRSVEFRLRALANSTAPTWLIWLLRRSSIDKALLPPTPSQNTENAFSISPTSFHSSVKLHRHKVPKLVLNTPHNVCNSTTLSHYSC